MNRAASLLVPLLPAVALAEVPADWAAADRKAAAMVTADIKGLLIQGTVVLPTVLHTEAQWRLGGGRYHCRC